MLIYMFFTMKNNKISDTKYTEPLVWNMYFIKDSLVNYSTPKKK